MSTTTKQYAQLEARIKKGDLDALLARWEFGRKLLEERGEKERLPKGRMKDICNMLQLPPSSVREFQNRMQFAEQYSTPSKVPFVERCLDANQHAISAGPPTLEERPHEPSGSREASADQSCCPRWELHVGHERPHYSLS